MSDIAINWDKITRGLPKGRRYTDDRAPTLEEIKKLCEYPDRRIKAIVYTMVSSGIRVGAWDYLRWGNIKPIEQDGKIVAARMVVYDGEEDAYISFITQSAYRELAQWMKYREEAGERINGYSWGMRDLWDTQVKISRGLVSIYRLYFKIRINHATKHFHLIGSISAITIKIEFLKTRVNSILPLQGVELYSIILRYEFILTYFFIGMQSSEDVRTILKLSLAIAILMIGVDMQQASADNNNGDGKKCNDHHHDSGSSQCSHKDPTPFILPFP